VAIGPQLVRFVTHLDFKAEELNTLEKILNLISK
jgi:threonine aldolase